MSARKKGVAAPEDLFARRRKALVERMRKQPGGDAAVALFFSGEEQNLVPFLPDPNFYYFTGVESPKAALLIHTTPQKSDELLFLPAPDPAAERWTGKVLTAGGLTESADPDPVRRGAMKRTGFGSLSAYHQIEEALVRPLRAARTVYLDFPEDAIQGPIGLTQLFWERLRARYPFLELRHLGRLAGGLRRLKGPEEIRALREAIAVTRDAHAAAAGHLRPGMREYELQALVEYAFKVGGAQRLSFPSIVGSGPWSCILHYEKNRRTMKAGDLVVLDVGARKDFYCADITRTYPVSGTFTKRQRKVYDVVLAARDAAVAKVKPGVFVHEVHKAATEVIAKAGLGKYFFHGTSHYLGLEAHDVGSYDEPLEPGAVITVEPGVYIAAEELGVRIEDDVAVTAKGCEVLSADIPREARDLEALLAEPRKKIIL